MTYPERGIILDAFFHLLENTMLQLLTTYSFETRAPAILGAKIKNAKLVSILDYSTAVKTYSVNSQHANIYRHLPMGTVRDPSKYTYYVFETVNGERKCFADVWINDTSVTVVTADTLVVTVYNTNNDDRERLRTLLLSAGFDQFSIDIG